MLLIVENDLGFAQLLLDAAREKGFKGIVTSSGVSALALAAEYMPAAVTLDIFLPDIDGWRVLDRLKNDDQTRHIPVSVISTDESRERALKSGAFQFAAKPMQSKEDVDALLDRLVALPAAHAASSAGGVGRRRQAQLVRAVLWRADDVKVTAVDDYEDAAAVLTREPVDCVVFDGALAPPPDALLPARRPTAATAPDAAADPALRRGQGRQRVRPLGRRSPSAPACAKCARPSGCSSRRASACIASPAAMPDTHRGDAEGAAAMPTKCCRARR